ncbi:MAG: heavy-metal-associated domain-containing protein [bacterium]|jgi:copper chaperone CopZ|nr:heavy-metal-associated domain-containing protein [bacterium]
MESKTFEVPNIGCDGCVRTIKNEVAQLPGVVTVDADVNSRLVTVQWQSPSSWEQIAGKLKEIDYPPANN